MSRVALVVVVVQFEATFINRLPFSLRSVFPHIFDLQSPFVVVVVIVVMFPYNHFPMKYVSMRVCGLD